MPSSLSVTTTCMSSRLSPSFSSPQVKSFLPLIKRLFL